MSLFVPDAAVVKQAYEEHKISFPYWSKIWPAAAALSEFIEHHPQYVANKRVVEIGAGLGLPSLVAASSASHVLCTDFSEEAISIVAKSALHHRLKNFETAVVDWKNLPQNIRTDVLLLSDVNYEPGAFAALKKTMNRFLDNGTIVLLSTPQRLMAKPFIEHVLHNCVQKEEHTVEQFGDSIAITVMVLKKKES